MDKCAYHIKIINEFINYCKNDKIDECMVLISNDIKFISIHNDTYYGKDRFKKYLLKNNLYESYKQPYWSAMDRMYRIDVKNKFMFMNIKTKHLIKFSNNNQIEYYHITYH